MEKSGFTLKKCVICRNAVGEGVTDGRRPAMRVLVVEDDGEEDGREVKEDDSFTIRRRAETPAGAIVTP